MKSFLSPTLFALCVVATQTTAVRAAETSSSSPATTSPAATAPPTTSGATSSQSSTGSATTSNSTTSTSTTTTTAETTTSVFNSAYATAPFVAQKTNRAVLQNGLTLITQADRTSPRVAFSLVVRAGAADETSETAGWRRMLAEAMLRATQTRNSLQADENAQTSAMRARAAEEIGGQIGATVSDDAIEFWASGESQNANALLDLLLQTVRFPRLAEEDAEAARKTLTTRRAALADDVTTLATSALSSQLFHDEQNQPIAYGLPTLGTETSLQNLTSTRLRALHGAFFGNVRLVVAASGDLDEANIVSRLSSFAVANTSNTITIAPPVFAPRASSKPVVLTQTSLVPGDWVFMSFRLGAANDEDAAALSVLAALLGASPASSLAQNLLSPLASSTRKPTEPLAQQVSAALTPRRFGSDLTIFALSGSADAESLRQKISSETKRLHDTVLTKEELAKARAYAVGDWVLSGENLRERAFRLASDDALSVSQPNINATARLQNVTAQDVQRVAQKYLNDEATVIVRAVS